MPARRPRGRSWCSRAGILSRAADRASARRGLLRREGSECRSGIMTREECMSNARDLRTAGEAGARIGTSAAGIAPGKRTLVETLPGASPAPAHEAKAGQSEPSQRIRVDALPTETTHVTSVLRKGSTSPETAAGQRAPGPGADLEAAHQAVAPSGAPTL